MPTEAVQCLEMLTNASSGRTWDLDTYVLMYLLPAVISAASEVVTWQRLKEHHFLLVSWRGMSQRVPRHARCTDNVDVDPPDATTWSAASIAYLTID